MENEEEKQIWEKPFLTIYDIKKDTENGLLEDTDGALLEDFDS